MILDGRKSQRTSNVNLKPNTEPSLVYLDVARALAALVVMASHLRKILLGDYKDFHHLGLLWRPFYFVTNLGREAVIVFFVLSGFLISKSVCNLAVSSRWSWRSYAIKRLSRLWMVLVPALVLTLLLDHLGMRSSPALYAGRLNPVLGSMPLTSASYAPSTFIGNILFLQEVAVPSFGSDTPLWSLANEFWYYVLFPLFYFSMRTYYKLPVRITLFALASTLCLGPLRQQAPLGLVWLLGYLVLLSLPYIRRCSKLSRIGIASGAALGLVLALVYFESTGTFAGGSEFILGFLFASLLGVLTTFRLARFGTRLATFVASFSYTLYVIHLPLFAFLTSVLLHSARLAPNMSGLAAYGACFFAAIVCAYVMSLLFERNTARVQATLLRMASRANVQFIAAESAEEKQLSSS
jgi:peptidoglycan/LPS O-acetylase OafA/YrhL